MASSSHTDVTSSGEPTTTMTFLIAAAAKSDWHDVSTLSTYENVTINKEEFLREKEDEFAMYVLPAIVYVAVLLTMGVPGNLMVLYVYNRRLTTGTYRWFVQALAFYDLVCCLLGMPGEILDMRRNYTFGSSPFCQAFAMVTVFSAIASIVTLCVIAVDRYRHCCTPFARQIDARTAKILIAICTVAVVIVSSPAAILYGHHVILTDNPAINGSDCFLADVYAPTIYPMIFLGSQFVIFFTAVFIMVVLYSMIARTIWKQDRFRKSGFKGKSQKSSSSVGSRPTCSSSDVVDTNSSSAKAERDAFVMTEMKGNDVAVENDPSSEGKENKIWIKGETENSISSEAVENNYAVTKVKGTERQKDNLEKGESAGSTRSQTVQSRKTPRSAISEETRRLTWMLFLVTLVFILSFLPYLCMTVAKLLEESSAPVYLSGYDLGWQYILLRSYFINSMANPVIYSFCSRTFRKECSAILCFRKR